MYFLMFDVLTRFGFMSPAVGELATSLMESYALNTPAPEDWYVYSLTFLQQLSHLIQQRSMNDLKENL